MTNLLRPDPRRIFSDLDRRLGVLERRIDPDKTAAPKRPRVPSITVAASDTPDDLRLGAMFFCDGTNDHSEIQAAVDLASATSPAAEVVLLAGTFNIGNSLNLTCNLRGEGTVVISGPGSIGMVVMSADTHLENVTVSASTSATANVVTMGTRSSLSRCTVKGNPTVGDKLVYCDSWCRVTNCLIQLTDGAGTGHSIEVGQGCAVSGLVVYLPLTGLAIAAGEMLVSGIGARVDAAMAWASSLHTANFLEVTGDRNVVLLSLHGGTGTNVAATVSGDENLVFYTPTGVYAADADTGTNNRINSVGGGGGSGISATIVDAKGDLIAATAADTVARQAVGANGTFLKADSAQTTGLVWAALADADIPATVARDTEVVLQTLADAKGDLLAATATDTWARLAVGTDGQVLTADSAQATGVKWAAAGGSGDVTDAFVPYYLGTGETFTVPEFRQALYVEPIELDGGTLDAEGLLVEVDQPPDLSALVHMGTC